MLRTALKHAVDKQLLLDVVPLLADAHVIDIPAVRVQNIADDSMKVIVADSVVIADKGRIIIKTT